MKLPAYIQKVKGEFPNINYLTAYIGLKRFQARDVKFFENVEEILDKVTPETVVYGGIPVMDKVFTHLGVKPHVDYYPEELKQFLGRCVFESTVAEVHKIVEEGCPLFVKPPYEIKKSFTGHVMNKFVDLIRMNHLEDNQKVICSELVKFVSEYRFFIHKDLGVLGCKHYAGDWAKTIDFSIGEVCRELFTKSPICYSLDMGLTKDGRTLLVECNDALSLGCYGLDPSMFSIMIVDRWSEIMKDVQTKTNS